MNLSEQDIERIVQLVLARLESLQSPSDCGCGCKGSKGDSCSGAMQVSERVVTLRQVEGKLKGVSRVSVSPKAVVTPAVRDLLRDKNIKMVREAAN